MAPLHLSLALLIATQLPHQVKLTQEVEDSDSSSNLMKSSGWIPLKKAIKIEQKHNGAQNFKIPKEASDRIDDDDIMMDTVASGSAQHLQYSKPSGAIKLEPLPSKDNDLETGEILSKDDTANITASASEGNFDVLRPARQATYGAPAAEENCYVETPCTRSCGDGFKLLLPNPDALTCYGAALQVFPCNLGACPVHCAWGHWTPWSGCSVKTSRKRVKRDKGAGAQPLTFFGQQNHQQQHHHHNHNTNANQQFVSLGQQQSAPQTAGYGAPLPDYGAASGPPVCTQNRARTVEIPALNGGDQCWGESAEERFCQSAQCQGPPGPQGPSGQNGVPGRDGNPGTSGTPGSRGSPGNPGSNGNPGTPGKNGKDGIPGNSGPQGPSGKDGSRGLPGKTGIPGPQGPPGAPGPRGRFGDKGPEGPSGAPGQTGPGGKDGSNGPPGPAGPPGLDGAPGSQGPMGSAGTQGIQGETGAAGPRGLTGPKGDSGSPAALPSYGAPEPLPSYGAQPSYSGASSGQLQFQQQNSVVPQQFQQQNAAPQQFQQQNAAPQQFQQQNFNNQSPPPRPTSKPFNPINGGIFSPFFPNKKRETNLNDIPDNWNAVEIVQSLRAPRAPVKRGLDGGYDYEDENVISLTGAFEKVQARELTQESQRDERKYSKDKNVKNGVFQEVSLHKPKINAYGNPVYDLTEPDQKDQKSKFSPFTPSKSDKSVVAEQPPLSGEVLKSGKVKKVNLAQVEADIKKAILKIDNEQKRGQQLLAAQKQIQAPRGANIQKQPPPPRAINIPAHLQKQPIGGAHVQQHQLPLRGANLQKPPPRGLKKPQQPPRNTNLQQQPPRAANAQPLRVPNTQQQLLRRPPPRAQRPPNGSPRRIPRPKLPPRQNPNQLPRLL